MANETSGEFLDPRGFRMPLSAASPEAFRILVTRKLAAGWSAIPDSPIVAPLVDEATLAIPEPLPPPPYDVVISRLPSGDVIESLTETAPKAGKRAKRPTETPEE